MIQVDKTACPSEFNDGKQINQFFEYENTSSPPNVIITGVDSGDPPSDNTNGQDGPLKWVETLPEASRFNAPGDSWRRKSSIFAAHPRTIRTSIPANLTTAIRMETSIYRSKISHRQNEITVPIYDDRLK